MCVVRTSSKSAAFIQNHLNNTTQRINKTTKYKHTQGVKLCVRVIVYNYFRGVRCVVSYINTNQSATNSQPNRISKEENKNKRLFNYTQMREKLHTNGKFDDAFRALYLYDIQLFSSPPYSSKWKKTTKKQKKWLLYMTYFFVLYRCVFIIYLSGGFFALVCSILFILSLIFAGIFIFSTALPVCSAVIGMA